MQKKQDALQKIKIIGLGGLISSTLFFTSCVPEVGQTKLRKKASDSATSNTAGSVDATYGRVLLDNPIVLSGNSTLSQTVDLSRYLSSPQVIVDDFFLRAEGPCAGLETCFEVKATANSNSALQSESKKWAYVTTSEEFTQVNTYFHLNKIMNQFYQTIYGGYANAWDFTTSNYVTSYPQNLVDTNGNINFFWQNPYQVYAECEIAGNAYFDASKDELCFGKDAKYAQVKFAHDPTIIYHEAGHLFIHLAINLRNSAASTLTTQSLGAVSYDEAGAIGEGLSDFFSYYVNGRSHIGEWALGRFLKQSRPLSEDDALHPAGIGTDDASSRITYPNYLTYDPNLPEVPYEDIHYAGMIISHYLVAQSQDFENYCGLTKAKASNAVMNLVIETLAELGDASGKGTDLAVTGGGDNVLGRVNGSASHAKTWITHNNPITYRSFVQTFAKFVKNTLGNSSLNLCNGSQYSQDRLEQLLDRYGLLIFRTYNDYRNEADPLSGSKYSVSVNPANRSLSTLIKKNLIKFDPTDGAAKAYVIDNRDQIGKAIAALRTRGLALDMSDQATNFEYNNGNGKISRGEVVGLVPNLYNDSNVTMGGIQVLANDFDHVARVLDTNTGTFKTRPCIFSDNDNWPTEAEGGTYDPSCSTATLNPNKSANLEVAPICLVQYNGTSSTQWITQKEFMEKLAMDSSSCLKSSEPEACFIRAIPGADQATFSKIDPKKTWSNSLIDPQTGKAPSFKYNNVLFFEISKQIPPGTIFDCRFRIRFTNCDDCYHDPDTLRKNYDYRDNEYNGHRPFRILHFQFPIVD